MEIMPMIAKPLLANFPLYGSLPHTSTQMHARLLLNIRLAQNWRNCHSSLDMGSSFQLYPLCDGGTKGNLCSALSQVLRCCLQEEKSFCRQPACPLRHRLDDFHLGMQQYHKILMAIKLYSPLLKSPPWCVSKDDYKQLGCRLAA